MKSVLVLAKWIRVCAIYPRFAMNLTGLLCYGTIDQGRLHTCLTSCSSHLSWENNKQDVRDAIAAAAAAAAADGGGP